MSSFLERLRQQRAQQDAREREEEIRSLAEREADKKRNPQKYETPQEKREREKREYKLREVALQSALLIRTSAIQLSNLIRGDRLYRYMKDYGYVSDMQYRYGAYPGRDQRELASDMIEIDVSSLCENLREETAWIIIEGQLDGSVKIGSTTLIGEQLGSQALIDRALENACKKPTFSKTTPFGGNSWSGAEG